MISPDLIVGPAVGGPEIDVLVGPITLEPKGDADEPARPTFRVSSRLASQIHLDRAITKQGIRDDGIRGGIECVGRGDQLDRTPTLIVRLSDRHVLSFQSIDALCQNRGRKEHQHGRADHRHA